MAYSEEYFIHVQGLQKGPYTFPQLKRLYDNNLIPEETLFWRDGMEQLQPVSDLCGASRRERLRRLRRLRAIGILVVVAIALLTCYCVPVLKDGWREMNDRDPTPEGAYWKARGFVREEVKRQQASVAFQPFSAATVTTTGSDATILLPGTIYDGNGSTEKKTWRVSIHYDSARREWKLPEP